MRSHSIGERTRFHVQLLIALALGLFAACTGWSAEQVAADDVALAAAPATVLTDPFPALHQRELELQSRLPARRELGLLMRGLSDFGPGWFTAGIVALLFFAVNPRLAVRLAVFLVIALWLREILALACHSPRPYWLESEVLARGGSPRRSSFGFPSGHAMVGLAFWFYLAAEVRRRWTWGTAALIACLIGVSRVYLGVHFISDVVVGWIVGWLFVGLYRRWEPRVVAWCASSRPATWVGAAIAVGVAMVLAGYAVRATVPVVPPDLAWTEYAQSARRLGAIAGLAGGLVGVAVGVWHFGGWPDPNAPLWLRVVRVVLAGGVVRLLADPAASLLTDRLAAFDREWVRVTGVFVINAWKYWLVWALLPWCFLKARLAQREPLAGAKTIEVAQGVS